MTAKFHRRWRPLEGVVVVDLSRMLPGGTTSLLLADLGAEIHKVEPPSGEESRYLKPSVGENSSVQHQYLDRGKHAYRIDLKTSEGLAQVKDLVKRADAVLESSRPGVADRLGVGFNDLVRIQPRLVYVSLTGYGQEGPMSNFAGHDLNFVSLAGMLGESHPTFAGADMSGGILGALAVVSGIFDARRTGQPRHVDLSLFDAALFLNGMPVAEALSKSALGEAVDTPLDGTAPCYQVYACADGRRLVVAAIERKFWQEVVMRLNRPEWLERQFDATLIPELQDLFLTRNCSEWMDLLFAPDTCVTPVRRRNELDSDNHISSRESIVWMESEAGPLPQPASPFAIRYTSDNDPHEPLSS